ncbi:MAG: hypothetical protein CMJ78_09535 [Planctomycetaceae bacterium]|nr:hypothetical protein [Planctomycetaceae bacterium]
MITYSRTPSILLLAFVVSCGILGCSNGGGNATNGDGSATTGNGTDTPPDGSRVQLSLGTAPLGGTFPIVGDAIAQTVNSHPGSVNWNVTAQGTKGSQENIRRIDRGQLNFALSNSAISYHAVNGLAPWDKKYELRTIVTLAPNVAMFVAKADSGIKDIAGLKEKKVVIGPAGAGFEMFVGPILEEHGVSIADLDARNDPQGPAVGKLGDGDVDAAFLGGAVPAASISQAAASFEITFIPFDPAVRKKLIEKYDFFTPFTIPADTYPAQEEAFDGLNVGSMHLITSADTDEDLVYELTKSIWENRADVAEKHGAGKAINEKNAARFTGTQFHPGAIKFYKEIEIWPETDGEPEAAKESEAAPKEEEKEAPADKAEESKEEKE